MTTSERYITNDRAVIVSSIEHLRMICSDEDNDLLADMIEGELDVEGFVGKTLEFILADEAAVEGIKAHAKRITERRRRLESRIERLRTLLASVVTALPGRKFRHPLASISAFDVDPRVIVQDESAIPSAFWVPQDPKLNESMLRRHLLERRRLLEESARLVSENQRRAACKMIDLDHPDVPGATLGNGEISVRIRVA